MSETEEEFLVYAELDESISIDSYRTIHLLGIDNVNPVIQMDDSFFTGKYEHPLGTYMFFEEDLNPESKDQLFDKLPPKNLKYLCKTGKVLNMERIYVAPKEGTEQKVENKCQDQEKEIQLVNFHSLQEAIEHFKNKWKPPALETYTTAVNVTNQDVKIESPLESDKMPVD